MDAMFDRQAAIRLSGMSEKAYIRSFNSMQNGIGVKSVFDFVNFSFFFLVLFCPQSYGIGISLLMQLIIRFLLSMLQEQD